MNGDLIIRAIVHSCRGSRNFYVEEEQNIVSYKKRSPLFVSPRSENNFLLFIRDGLKRGRRRRRRKRKDNRSHENGEPPRKDAFSICEAEEQTLSCGAKLVRPRGTSKVRSFQTRLADNASRKLYPNEMDLSLSMLFRISPISKL